MKLFRNGLSWTLIGLSFASLAEPSFAQIPETSRLQFEQRFPIFPGPSGLDLETRGALTSIWGTARKMSKTIVCCGVYQRTIDLPEFFNKPIRVLFHPHHRRRRKPNISGRKSSTVYDKIKLKAPLSIFIPGVMASAEDRAGKNMIQKLRALGHHVLVLPNPSSADVINTQKVPPEEHSPRFESMWIYAAVNKVANEWLGRKYYTQINIVGESLGAFTASRLYALDHSNRNQAPIFNGTLLALWPPTNLVNSTFLVDKMLREQKNFFIENCQDFSNLTRFNRILDNSFILSPSDFEIGCAKAVLAVRGFGTRLFKNVEEIKEARPAEERAELGEINSFLSFMKVIEPQYFEMLMNNDPKMQLSYWLEMIHHNPSTNFAVIQSIDDPINYPEVTTELAQQFPHHVLLHNWGGHLGLSNETETWNLIQEIFENIKN